MPGVSTVLSLITAAYSDYKTEKFRNAVKNALENIESELGDVIQDLKNIQADIDMNQLYASTDEAQARVSTWWTEEVKPWIEKETPITHSVAVKIRKNAASYLDNIDFAIRAQSTFSKGLWLDLAIKQIMARQGSVLMPTSVCELSYRYFLQLLFLQLKALVALSAVGDTTDLLPSMKKVIARIPKQQNACQGVVNNYEKTDSFTWFGWPNTATSNYHTWSFDDDKLYCYFNGTGPGQVITGVQFQANSSSYGPYVDLATVGAGGALTGAVPDSPFDPVYPNADASKKMYFSSASGGGFHSYNYVSADLSDIVLPDGYVLTALQLRLTRTAKSGYKNETDTDSIWLTAQCMKLDQSGALSDTKQLDTEGGNVQSILSGGENVYISLDGVGGNLYAPLTGVRLAKTGNQLSWNLQCRYHLNAFDPNN